MRISDWSSDVCSSDLHQHLPVVAAQRLVVEIETDHRIGAELLRFVGHAFQRQRLGLAQFVLIAARATAEDVGNAGEEVTRSEERRVGTECVSTCRSRWSPSN